MRDMRETEMKITREINGETVDIWLLPEEINQAYYIEQYKLAVSDAYLFADICDDMYTGQPYIDVIRKDPDFVHAVAEDYRNRLDYSDGENWFGIMSEAVMDVGRKLKGEAN